MTRIDFYILDQTDVEQRLLFACRLIDKAFRQGNRILINTSDQASAEHLDDLLWSFRPESFIPHALTGSDEAASVPVVICAGDDSKEHHDLLINLARDVPAFFSRFERLVEVVIQDQQVLDDTRQHFTFFKQRGYPIETHKLQLSGR